MRIASSLVLVALGAGAEGAVDCNTPPARALTIELPGHPFHTVSTRDGCWIFAAVAGPAAPEDEKKFSGVVVLRREGGRAEIVRSVPLNPRVFGLALTHDDRILL